MVFFFFGTKKIWDPNKVNKTIKDHLLAGVKLLIQFPFVYFLKILFVNLVVIPKLQSMGSEIETISQSNIITAIIVTVIFLFSIWVFV